MSTQLRSIAGTLVFTFVVPGTVALWLPFALGLIQFSQHKPTAQFICGLFLLSIGAIVYASCAFSFAWQGRGTPSPTHETSDLVVSGLYNYSRNPMYAGVLAVLVGEFLAFGTSAIGALIYAAGFLSAVSLFIHVYEEPTLHKKFGAQYAEYCARVPRWIPTRPRVR